MIELWLPEIVAQLFLQLSQQFFSQLIYSGTMHTSGLILHGTYTCISEVLGLFSGNPLFPEIVHKNQTV